MTTSVTGFECPQSGPGSGYPGAVFANYQSIPAAIPAGSTIIVKCSKSADNSYATAFKDTQGNTYDQVQSLENTPGDEWIYVFVAENVTALSSVGPTLVTNAETTAGSDTLQFASTTGVEIGMTATAYGLEFGATVTGVTSTTVTVSPAATGDMVSGYKVAFGDCLYFNLVPTGEGGTDHVGFYAIIVTGGLANPSYLTSNIGTNSNVTGAGAGNVTSGTVSGLGASALLVGMALNVTANNSGSPYYASPENLTQLATWWGDVNSSGPPLGTIGYGTFTSAGATAAQFNSPSTSSADTYLASVVALALAESSPSGTNQSQLLLGA